MTSRDGAQGLAAQGLQRVGRLAGQDLEGGVTPHRGEDGAHYGQGLVHEAPVGGRLGR